MNSESESNVSDLRYLTETMAGNKILIKEIIDLFLQQAPEELSNLNQAVQEEDYVRIKNYSHTMKSSVSIMGIAALDFLLKEMEDLAKNSLNIERIRVLDKSITIICKQALKEIENQKVNFI